jgi:hypothetical protein
MWDLRSLSVSPGNLELHEIFRHNGLGENLAGLFEKSALFSPVAGREMGEGETSNPGMAGHLCRLSDRGMTSGLGFIQILRQKHAVMDKQVCL